MIRTLTILLISALAGSAFGYLQATLSTGRLEERMMISRESLAEARGEATREEIMKIAGGTPRVEVVGGTHYDFGMMRSGDSMSHDFVFKNVGDGPLTLDMGNSSCKCTVGELDNSILMPGEETVVKLTWEAKTPLRDFGQNATIITNDIDQREIKLTIEGLIAGAYVIEPEVLALGEILDSKGTERTFHVFSYREDSKEIMDFTWSKPRTREYVEVASKPIEVDPEKFPLHSGAFAAHEVTLKIKPGLPVGRFSGHIQFRTDRGDELGNLEVQVAANVSGLYELRGGPSFDRELSLLKIGAVDPREGALVSVFLVAQGDDKDDIKIEVVSAEPEEALEIEVAPPTGRDEKRMYPIRFRVPKGAPEVYYPGSGKDTYGKVVLRVTGDKTQEIPVFLRLVVKEQ